MGYTRYVIVLVYSSIYVGGLICLDFSGDLEGGAISDIANDATAYAQRDSLVRILLTHSHVTSHFLRHLLTRDWDRVLQFALTAYSIAELPFPDDDLAFLNGMVDTIYKAMPDGNFGVYPGYVEYVPPPPSLPLSPSPSSSSSYTITTTHLPRTAPSSPNPNGQPGIGARTTPASWRLKNGTTRRTCS